MSSLYTTIYPRACHLPITRPAGGWDSKNSRRLSKPVTNNAHGSFNSIRNALEVQNSCQRDEWNAKTSCPARPAERRRRSTPQFSNQATTAVNSRIDCPDEKTHSHLRSLWGGC